MRYIRNLLLDHPPKAWLVLGFSLVVTWFAWHVSSEYADKRIIERFGYETADLKAAIAKRMQDQEQVLLGGVGLFAASESVNRAEWRRYAESLQLARYYPGLQGLGYAEIVPTDGVDAHVARIRAEGFPDYEIRPPGLRDTLTSIVYLEPFDWRNQRAFGFDMFSEANRRAAMERARDTGQPAMSGVVTLVQETDEDVQRGFLLYLPVYRNDAPVRTIAERRAALTGFVYSPFRMNDLMNGILGAGHEGLAFALYDGLEPSEENRLYESGSHRASSMQILPDDVLETTTEIEFAGRAWTAHFWAKSDYMNALEKAQPLFIAVAGLLLDLMIFIVISSISRQHRQVTRRAEALTIDYRQAADTKQAIVDAVKNGIISISPSGHILSANPAAAQMFGLTQREIGSRKFDSLLTAKSRTTVSKKLEPLSELTRPVAFAEAEELLGVRRDGSFVPLELSVTPLGLEGRSEFSVVLTDLTERQRNDRLKSEFVSTVSHELRTPLTSIRGAIGLIAAGAAGAVPDQVRELATIAHNNCERMTLIINDILDLQKIAAGRLEIHKTRLNVAEVVSEAVQANTVFAERQGIALIKRDIDAALAIDADVDRLMQVLSNLLSNAIKFSGDSTRVEIGAVADDDDIVISVCDNGIGIDPEFHDRIFENFARADNTNTRTVDGTGLGLAISRRLVEAMAGTISFDSEVSTGTTFHLRFPQAADDAPSVMGREPAASNAA